MRRIAIILTGLLLFAMVCSDARACSVCQGDPDSGLTKGAEAGVILMVIVTYGVLLSFVGIIAVWFVKARRIRSRSADSSRDTIASDSPDS